MRTLPRWLFSATAFAAIVFASDARTEKPPAPPDGAPPRGGERVLIPNMEAGGRFFADTLAVDIRFGRMERPRRDGPPEGDTKESGDASAENKDKAKRKGGGKKGKGGPPPGGGGGRRGGGMGGPPGGGGDSSDRAMNIREERNPATQFHVTLTNRGAAPLVVEVLDFESALGNFAVKPDKITIAPGQSAQTDPMISRLGIPTEDLPLKIRVRTGGKSEAQTLTLKILPPPEAE